MAIIPSTEQLPANAIIRAPEAARMVGCSRSHLWRMTKAGTFPKPVKTGPGMTGWLKCEIDAWISLRVKERDCLTAGLAKEAK